MLKVQEKNLMIIIWDNNELKNFSEADDNKGTDGELKI